MPADCQTDIMVIFVFRGLSVAHKWFGGGTDEFVIEKYVMV